MDDDEFRKTNVKVACVLKMELDSVSEFKKDLLELLKMYGASIIYHTVSPYKLVIVEDKKEQ